MSCFCVCGGNPFQDRFLSRHTVLVQRVRRGEETSPRRVMEALVHIWNSESVGIQMLEAAECEDVLDSWGSPNASGAGPGSTGGSPQGGEGGGPREKEWERELAQGQAQRQLEREVKRLKEALAGADQERSSAVREAEELRRELERLKAGHAAGEPDAALGPGAWPRRPPGAVAVPLGSVIEALEDLPLEEQVYALRREVAAVREDREATVGELLAQVMALNSKLQGARREREAAVQAGERQLEVMKRELAAVVEKHENSEADAVKARASIARAEEYLKVRISGPPHDSCVS